MDKYLFWSKWHRPYNYVASFLFSVLVVLVLASLVLLAMGPETLIGWHTYSQRFAVDIVREVVAVGPFSFPFQEQLFVIKEFVSGGGFPAMVWANQLTLVLVLGTFTLFITLITYFNRWAFLVFAGLVFTFIIYLHPEMLQIVGLEDKWILGIVFMLVMGPAYYFHSFKKDASFGLRLLIILLSVALFLILAVSQSKVLSPLHALMSYGLLAPYLVVLLFVFMVGHEVVNGFLIGIAGNKDNEGNNRIKHFLVITLIYLINVLLSYLEITHIINWNFITLSPFVLLATATLLGVWGISQRFVLYKKVSPHQQVWVLLYLALAVMSYAIITYLMLSMEDPMLKIIGDFIVFTQLAFGTAFMLYIVYNFITVIEKGFAMKDILYKPQNLPHFTYRLVGMLIITALVLMRDIKYPIWYSLGGFYNSIADYFYAHKDFDTAGVFYEKGGELSRNNHKSNYMLGMMNIDSNRPLAIEYFGKAASRVPTSQAYVNKANLESDEGKYFEALFTLQQGESTLGKSIEVQNNLGLQFSKANMLDSAWYYYLHAIKTSVARNNAMAFVLENNFTLSPSDSSELFASLDAVGEVNASALGMQPTLPVEINGDHMMSASLLNNILVNQLINDLETVLPSIVTVVDSTHNPNSFEELSFALAMNELRNERIASALLRLQHLVSLGSEKQALYYETLGLINLKYKSYNEAETFFYLALQAGSKTVLQQLAVAQTEAGYFEDALTTWSEIEQQGIENTALRASIMKRVINSILNENDSISGDDLSLYLKARYQRLWVDEFSVKETFDRIKEKNLKNQLALDLAIYYFEMGNVVATKLYYETIDPEIGTEIILRPLLYFNLRLAYAGLIPNLDEQLELFYEAGFEFDSNEYLHKVFFETNRKEISSEVAEKLATQDPYFEEGVVWAADFFDKDADEYRSYNLLQEALEKNPDSRLLLEAYILRAIDLGLEDYANQSLLHYRELFPGQQYNIFAKQVNNRRKAFDALVEEI